MRCRLVVGRELVQCKLAVAALEEERHNYSSEAEEAQQPLGQAPVQGVRQRSSPKDPVAGVVVVVAGEVEQEEPCLVLRHLALLDQEQRRQMDQYYSPASPARQ